jgi:hypothetical protein
MTQSEWSTVHTVTAQCELLEEIGVSSAVQEVSGTTVGAYRSKSASSALTDSSLGSRQMAKGGQ